jgi:hypothetical protein
MNKPKVTDPSLSQQSIMSALCRTPRLSGLFNIDFLSSPFGHPRAATGVMSTLPRILAVNGAMLHESGAQSGGSAVKRKFAIN